jgi:protein O-mannosyl-transferase
MTLASNARLLHVGLLLAFAAAAWWNAFGGAFVYDDVNILNAAMPETSRELAATLANGIRPLVKLGFLADRMLWGEAPAGYHLAGVALHSGCVLLVYALVTRLDPRAGMTAFWAALAFLVHPLATESVTYISGRATVAMAFFYLAAVYLYVCGRRAWALAAFGMALASKELAITLPLALLLMDGGRLKRAQLAFWAVLAAWLAAAALHPRYAYLLQESLAVRPAVENLAVQANVLAYALTLFVDASRLSLVHGLDAVTSFADRRTLLSLALLAALGATVMAKGERLERIGIAWFFLQLLPAHSLLPRYELLSERNLYLAAPGLFLVIASVGCRLAARLRPRGQRLAALAAFAGLAALAAATFARNELYADPVALWSDTARKAPDSAAARVNLGYARYERGDLDGAIADFRAALALDRNNPVAHANLASAWRLRAQARTHPSAGAPSPGGP